MSISTCVLLASIWSIVDRYGLIGNIRDPNKRRAYIELFLAQSGYKHFFGTFCKEEK